MRKARIILLFAILFGTLAFVQPVSYQPGSFKPGSEPDGFRGIRWGTPISLLNQMIQVWEEGDLRYYEMEGDVLEIGGAKLHKIIYVFWNDRFLEARTLILKNYDPAQDELCNFNMIKEICFDKFGGKKKPMFGREQYSWLGDRAWVWLGAEDPGFLRLNISSAELQRQRNALAEEKTRQEEGFRLLKAKEAKGL